MAGWFYRAMHREPVVMWSCFIGAARADALDRPARGVRVRGDARDGRAERGGGRGGAATGDSRGVSDATRRDATRRERRVYEQRARGRARETSEEEALFSGVFIPTVEPHHDQPKARARPTTTHSTNSTNSTLDRSRPLDRRARRTRARARVPFPSHPTHNCDDASHAQQPLYENTRTSCRTTASRARNYGTVEKKGDFRGQVVRRPLRKGKIAGSNPVESTFFLLRLFLPQYASNVRKMS